MAVVPTGRVTAEGKPIFKAAPTPTTIAREVSARRVQTFGPGGRKISDTGRVEVTVQGERKFVTLERAKELGTKSEQQEARTKIKRREQLESTIRARFERETKAEVKEEPTARKLAVTLRKEEVVKSKRPLELFTPLARERLGITETPEGLLEVRVGERKRVLEPQRVELRKTFVELVEEPFKKKEIVRQEVRAVIPLTAEFRTGFERQLGKEEKPLIGIKTPSGILTFKTIQEPITGKLKKVFEPSIQFFEEEQLKLKRELRGRPSVIEDRQFKKLGLQELRTIQLRAGQLAFGGEVGVRRQIAEQPLETAAIITTGVVFGTVTAIPSIAKAAAFRISSTVLGTAFVGVTGVEVGLQIRRGRFAEAGEIIGERAAEAVLFIGAGKLAARGVAGVRRIKFERGIKRFERGLPKFTEQELKARLGTGGIETRQVRRFPKEIQTTFGKDIRVKTAEEALRTRIFAKAKTPLKRPQPPSRIAIIKTSDIPGEPKILTLEKTGKFDISAFGETPKQFTRLRVQVGRLGDITIRDIGIQKTLVKPTTKTGRFRILPEPLKFESPVGKIPEPFKGKPSKGLDRALLAEPDTRLKLISKLESLVGKPGRLTPQEFARQKGFLFIEPPVERPRIDITKFGGREIKPRGVLTAKGTIKPPARIGSSASLGLFGTIKGLGIREAQDIISGQKLRTRLEVSQKVQQGLISDLERITGTKPKPAFDIATGLVSIQDIAQVQEQEQLLITIPKPGVPERGRPDIPLPFEPPFPPPTPPFLFFPKPRLFLGGPIKRKKRPLKPEFGFTPGFMSAVLGEFGQPPKPGQRFTGQERRFIIKGKPFLTPLPKKRSTGIVQLVARQLGG